MALIGAAVAVLGGATAVLFFFQPWRSCPYEDTSVGCAMLPNDAAVMVIALGIAVVGAGMFIAGRLQSHPSQDTRSSKEA
jgi:hypothetical protein